MTIVGAVERSAPGGSREARFADRAITRAMNAIGRTPAGSRNTALNGEAYALGRLVARGWLAGDLAVFALRHGAALCGYLRDHGEPFGLGFNPGELGFPAGFVSNLEAPAFPAVTVAGYTASNVGFGGPWKPRDVRSSSY